MDKWQTDYISGCKDRLPEGWIDNLKEVGSIYGQRMV